MVKVGVADAPGEGTRQFEIGAALQRGELEPPCSGRLVVGVLVLVLDVEHPGADRTPGDQGGDLDQQEGLPADHRAPAQDPGHQREVRRRDARQDPPVHAALREPALEEKDEARANQQHQERIAVDAVPEPPQAGGALVLGEGHRVDLADAAMVEVAGVRVVDPVLPLPPPVGGEEEVPEKVAPAAVRAPRFEERVVCEVVEERVHPGEEDSGDEAESDGGRGARSDQCCEHPDDQVRQDDARDLSEAAALVDLQIRAEVLFPALAGGDLCGVHCHSLRRPTVDGSAIQDCCPAANSVK